MRFLKKVEEKVQRFQEVEKLLQDPSVSTDQARLKDLGKEYSALKPFFLAYNDYQKVETQLDEVTKILADKKQAEDFITLAASEKEELEKRHAAIIAEIEKLVIQDDPMMAKNILLEIRAGTGGLEAGLFAAELFRMYTRFAATCGYKTEILSSSSNEAGGLKEVIASVTGKGAYGKFKYESGTHRVQRVPATEASGRIHTSAVTVAVLPEAEEVDVQINPEDIKLDTYCSSGPGGQSVNTTYSAVRITHIPTGTVVTCQDEKSQQKNKAKALKILRARLYENIVNERNAEIAKQRKEQVGSGDRSEKIRTYNFPDRRVTDHRIGLTVYNLEAVLEGEIDAFVNALFEAELAKS